MKDKKRIMALAGIVLLVGLYAATLVFALIDSPFAYSMFLACIYGTIAIPVLLYAMILVYKRLKEKNREMYGTSIDTVILDVGNVLVDYDYKRYLDTFGFSKEKIEAVAAAMFENPLWEEGDRGVLTEEELTEKFAESCPEYAEDLRAVYESIGGCCFPLPYSSQWVQELKDRGLKVYILSNFSSRIYRQTREQMAFLKYVDGALFSFTCHMIKPEDGIYKKLLEDYKIQPDRAVFVDDRQLNLEGAKKLGLGTLRFTTYEDTKRALERLLASK